MQLPGCPRPFQSPQIPRLPALNSRKWMVILGRQGCYTSYPPATGAHLLASFVTAPAPAHAKAMAKALADAVARYEANFGEIILPAAPQPASNGTAPPARARRA